MTDPARMAYLGGVLDYNNSIRMVKRRNRIVPMIHVANNDRAHIRLLTMTFGGGINVRRDGKFTFQRSHSRAVDVIRKIRPYLFLNADVADQAIEWDEAIVSAIVFTPRNAKKRPDKIPCSKCDGTMTLGYNMCQICYLNNTDQVIEPIITEYKAITRTGEVTTVGRVQTHRMRN